MSPARTSRIDHAALVLGAVLGTAPRLFGREVEHAEPCRSRRRRSGDSRSAGSPHASAIPAVCHSRRHPFAAAPSCGRRPARSIDRVGRLGIAVEPTGGKITAGLEDHRPSSIIVHAPGRDRHAVAMGEVDDLRNGVPCVGIGRGEPVSHREMCSSARPWATRSGDFGRVLDAGENERDVGVTERPQCVPERRRRVVEEPPGDLEPHLVVGEEERVGDLRQVLLGPDVDDEPRRGRDVQAQWCARGRDAQALRPSRGR